MFLSISTGGYTISDTGNLLEGQVLNPVSVLPTFTFNKVPDMIPSILSIDRFIWWYFVHKLMASLLKMLETRKAPQTTNDILAGK